MVLVVVSEWFKYILNSQCILRVLNKLNIVGHLLFEGYKFWGFCGFLDFHEICFTENYRKSYRDMDCRLKRNVDSWKFFPWAFFLQICSPRKRHPTVHINNDKCDILVFFSELGHNYGFTPNIHKALLYIRI